MVNRENPTRRSVFFLAGSLATGNIVASALRMVGGLLIARVVEPAVLGLFNGIGLVLGYAPFLQLGILNGLNRELPYCVGTGDNERVRDLASAAQAWALLVGGVTSVGLAAVSGWYAASGDWALAAGFGVNCLGVWRVFYGDFYLQITFRTRSDFTRLAGINVAANLLGVATIAVVWLFGYYGLCIRTIAIGLLQVGLLWWFRPLRVGPKWNKGHLLHLLKIGAPIFGVGQLYSWWGVLDSTIVLRLAGVEGLGLYSLVLMAGSTIQILPDAVSQVLYPQMAEEFGRSGQVRALGRLAQKPTIALVVGLVPVAILGWLVAPPFVPWILPKYREAVPAIQWAMVVPLVLAFSPIANIFNVVKRQDLYGVAILAGMMTYLVALFWLRNETTNIKAFPQAMLIGRTVFVGLCFASFAFLARGNSVPSKAS